MSFNFFKKLRGKKPPKNSVVMKDYEIEEYFSYLSSPWKVFLVNFLAGIARGFGFVIGATVFVALILYIVGNILVEIPLVGNFFEWLNKILLDNLGNNQVPGVGRE